MSKYAILILLVFVVGCKTIPNFPVVWFWSHQDLQKQQLEINKNFLEKGRY